MALSPEKISELKQIIHNHLSQFDVQSRIREALSQSMQDDGTQAQAMSETDLFENLRRRGVVDEIMQDLKFDKVETGDRATRKPATHFVDTEQKLKQNLTANIDPGKRHLYIQILGGKAFLEHLQEPEPLPGQITSTFTVHINFRGQRFKSKPAPCACEPAIVEGFLLEVHKENAGDAGRMADTTTMLSICDPVHIVLIKTDPSGDRSLLASHYLEWRSVLAAPDSRTTIAVELHGVGTENKVPVGILEIQLELLPKTKQTIPEEVISSQRALEKSKQAERERLFLVYAKQWWREYLQIRPTHSQRLVKIFAQDENGVNRPVCSYVKPLRTGRLLDTPREAARFVNLIGYERVPTVGNGERAEQWATMHGFLCRNKGDCEDHAVLLCSLLLGFGLDSYVCVGTKSKGAVHTWVMTLAPDGLVTFWESLTGNRYIHNPINPDDPPSVPQPKPVYPYRTVGCVFNHTSFYANSQVSDDVPICVFNFDDQSRWKSMSEDAIQSVCGAGAMPSWPALPQLCASPSDPLVASNDLEQQLRALIVQHREDIGLTTCWDDQLSYLLTPALAAYETERITGLSAGNEEFQHAIRRCVPDGHTFKGYPIQFVHRNARKAFTSSLRSQVCDEIVSCRGDHVRHGLRVRVFMYPESACAVWIMYACKYKSIL